MSLGYNASLINDCVFFHGDIIFMVYVDNGIFLGNNDTQYQLAIKEMQGLHLNIEDKETCKLGLSFKPNPNKGFECYCDADFLGLWNKALAPMDPSTSKS